MAIDAVDFDRRSRLAINFPIAVIVLREVAIIALHAFFEMNIRQVYRFPEALGIVESDLLAVLVQPIPLAIVVENRAKNPAVPVKISKLRGLQLLVEFGAAGFFQKCLIVPEAANGRALRIAFERLIALLLAGVALLRRIHLVAVDFVVPPRKPKISRDHIRAGMDMADHALARRNRTRENVFDRMAGFILRNRRIGRSAEAGMAEPSISAGVRRVAVVGIDDVTRRTPAAAIVAGMIVRARKRQDGVEQARFLQAEENGIGAQPGSEAALAEFVVRLAWLLFAVGIADLSFFSPAAFEHAKDVARLRSFPAKKRIELRNHALGAGFFRRGLWRRLDRLWPPIAIVAFAEAGVFCGKRAIVVERGAPQHPRVRHHAGGNRPRLRRMATGSAACFRSDPKIAGIHKLDVFSGFRKPLGVAALGKRGAIFERTIAGLNVGFFLDGIIFGRISRSEERRVGKECRS